MSAHLLETHSDYWLARDPQVVRELITRHLLRDDIELGRLEPVYSRFKGRHGGMVAYRLVLTVRGPGGSPESMPSFVTVRTGPRWRLASQFSRFTDPVFRTASPLAPAHLDHQLGLLLLSFPLDRALPALRKVVHPKGARRWMEALGTLDSSRPWRSSLSRSRVEIASYRPERRAVLRYRAVSRHGDPQNQTFYIRLHADGIMPFAASQALRWLRLADAPVPTLLGAPHLNAVAESSCPGRPLGLGDIQDSAQMREVGRVLARIHDLPPPPLLASTTASTLIKSSLACAGHLGAVDPALGARAKRHIEWLGVGDPASESRLLHGDLHAGQILSDGRRVSLIDWDRASAGDPAMDLGTLAARLEVDFNGAGRAAFLEAIDAYARVRNRPPDHRITWHRAHALLRLCDAPFRRLMPDWTAQTERILSSIEEPSQC